MSPDVQALVSPEVQAFSNGFPVTLLHAAVSLAILVVGVTLYALLTPHKEIRLIREGNSAAALSFAAVMVGLAAPIGLSLAASTSTIEIAIWGVATTVLQLAIFRLTDMVLTGLPERIQEGEISAAVVLAGARLAVAIVLAAAVSG